MISNGTYLMILAVFLVVIVIFLLAVFFYLRKTVANSKRTNSGNHGVESKVIFPTLKCKKGSFGFSFRVVIIRKLLLLNNLRLWNVTVLKGDFKISILGNSLEKDTTLKVQRGFLSKRDWLKITLSSFALMEMSFLIRTKRLKWFN